jgi:hypothetical protein
MWPVRRSAFSVVMSAKGVRAARAEIWHVDRRGRDVRYFGSMYGVCL